MTNKPFTMQDYQAQRPFASFLSGIAGKNGIPMWAFYVNRGQGLASCGIRDKNGAIMEFFPANAMFRHIARLGFRTFIKVDGKVKEYFVDGQPHQTMDIRPDQFAISQTDDEQKLHIRITYFTLPNASLAGLIRKVEITNLGGAQRSIEVMDGVAQLLPSGIDYGSYKSISHLLQSWMESENARDYMYFYLRSSTNDTAQVSECFDGNFYLSVGPTQPLYLSDIGLVFGEDTSLTHPHGFMEQSLEALGKLPQTHVNQLPCAFVGYPISLKDSLVFYALMGHANSREEITALKPDLTPAYFAHKEKENEALHEGLLDPIATATAFPLYDRYVKQCYLDNLIRGGVPMIIDTLDGRIGYHLFSRRHGDLERDYNFFSIEPAYYSQGNGAFRDVLQNRRSDVFFNPQIGDFEIRQFASLIQADGYNPLSVEGIVFAFAGDGAAYPESVQKVLGGEFTPGALYTALHAVGLDESVMKSILKQSHYHFKATFGEGYWEDHFTYLFDLVESYLAIFPDRERTLLTASGYPFFLSPVKVLPRSEKYVLNAKGQVRQYDAIQHLDGAPQSAWLTGKDKKRLEVNLIGKLLTLAINKYAHLDPDGIGLSYEGEKPGWNDAMNGVPGLCGSGVSEAIELTKLVKYLLDAALRYGDIEAELLTSFVTLADRLAAIRPQSAYDAWDQRMNALEVYRAGLADTQTLSIVRLEALVPLLRKMDADLSNAVLKARALGPIPPTYLTYEVTAFEPLTEHGKPRLAHNGMPLVKATAFKLQPLPSFLEAPARYLSSLATRVEGLPLYEAVRHSGLYDAPNHFYQTSVSLEACSHEIGRVRAFTPGWLEREANFLHMSYKYLLGLLKAGLYEAFYEEIKTNYTCFMDPKVYGRSPLENCSFIATTSNPDPKKRGQGFYARLSGSTAEVLSMWRFMFFGKHPFIYENDQLAFKLEPKLSREFFRDGIAETTLFGQVRLVIHNDGAFDTYAPNARVVKYDVQLSDSQAVHTIVADRVGAPLAQAIRNGQVSVIHAYVEGGK